MYECVGGVIDVRRLVCQIPKSQLSIAAPLPHAPYVSVLGLC